jgi:hypothetical protein
MLIEDWHGQPRKGMDILMGEEYSRQKIEQERQKGSSSGQADISSPPHRTQRSTDQSTPPSRNSSITLTAQQISDAAKAKQLIGEISFTQSPQSLHSSPMGLNVSQITPMPKNQPVMTTTDPDAIPPISSIWDTTSVLGKPRKPALAFPANKPLAGKTHLHGYWKSNGNWVSYAPPIEWNELPNNASYASDHWVGQFLPDKSYVHKLSNDGKFLFLREGDPTYPSSQRPASPTTRPLSPSQCPVSPTVRQPLPITHRSASPTIQPPATVTVPPPPDTSTTPPVITTTAPPDPAVTSPAIQVTSPIVPPDLSQMHLRLPQSVLQLPLLLQHPQFHHPYISRTLPAVFLIHHGLVATLYNPYRCVP